MLALVNFAALRAGGGQTVALNFINSIVELEKHHEFIYIAASGSVIAHKLTSLGLCVYELNHNPIARGIQELYLIPSLKRKHRFDKIYTYFGYTWNITNCTQIIGSADSNLYYPEIRFWEGFSTLRYTTLRLKDLYRIQCLKRADFVIFENPDLEERYKRLYGKGKRNSTTILPSYSATDGSHSPMAKPESNGFDILILCRWQRNKNLMLLPRIAHILRHEKIRFRLSLQQDSTNPLAKEMRELIHQLDVKDCFNFIGPQKPDTLSDTYSRSNAVLLLSKLESFSNNIIEAWKFNTPLIITDAPWARGICLDSALYVNRDSAEEISKVILTLKNSNNLRNELISKGKEALKRFPTIRERTRTELNVISKC